MERFTAAAVQLCSTPDRDANLARAERLVRAAAAGGARLVVLPELFAWRGPAEAEDAAAEPIPGPTSEAMGALARKLGIYIVAGSLLERSQDSRPYNTSLLLDPEGRIVARYRKLHLFDAELSGRVSAKESRWRRRGEEVVLAATPLATIGLSVCYDVRFPELYRRLVAGGATIVCIPSAFTAATGAAHWEVLLRARAIENQCYVIAPDQFGPSPSGHRSHGESMIVGPWGEVLARAGRDGEEVVSAEIDPAHLERVRTELPCLQHARLEA